MFYRCLPFINLCVTSSALLFQVTVTYPNNNKLGSQMNRIEKSILLLQQQKQNKNKGLE